MLAPNTILNSRYQIIRQIGAGGFGAVYLALDTRLGNHQVVVKENQSGDARQFEFEATTLATLVHPNLPRVSDYFLSAGGAQYLVMDFVGGENLETQLHRGAVPESQALLWMRQILNAVHYLHQNRIIHRDIKPQNVIITPQGKALLVDFGIAKRMRTGMMTTTGARAASAGYAAPEQYRGGTDQRSDVYSLGALLYSMLTAGAPPDARVLEQGTATITPPRRVNPAVSQNTENVIIRAMNVDPALRFDSVGTMLQELRIPATQTVTSAPRTTMPPASAPRPPTFVTPPTPSVHPAVSPTTTRASSGKQWTMIGIIGVLAMAVVCVSSVVALMILNTFSVGSGGPVATMATPTRMVTLTWMATPTRAPLVILTPTLVGDGVVPSIDPAAIATPTPGAASCALGAQTTVTDAPDDIPGKKLQMCANVVSTVDNKTKVRDVYALELTAGQEVRFAVTTSQYLYVALMNPDSKAIETRRYSEAFNTSVSRNWNGDFTPAVSGTYFFVVTAQASAQQYNLTIVPTGITVPGNKVARDIPGTKLELGTSVSSVVDKNTKKRDVYALELTAGQEVQFAATAKGYLYFALLNPESKAIETNRISESFNTNGRDRWSQTFTPAVSGTYFFVVTAQESGQRYTFSATATGNNVPGNQVASDIPGTKLAVGNTSASVVDANTKKRDVYAIDLTAGQEVRFAVSTSGYVYVGLANPGSKSFETRSTSETFSDSASSKWVRDFTPAVSGMYYFAVSSNQSGQRYTLSVTVTGNMVPGNQIASEIPGTKFSVGNTLSSVVDQNTKKRDVHALDLTANQEVRFTITSSGNMYFVLLKPGARSVESGQGSAVFSEYGRDKWVYDFTPTATGTYYLVVSGTGSGLTYTLSVVRR